MSYRYDDSMSNSAHELIGEVMLFIIGCSLGFMAGLIVMYLLDSWFFNKLIGEERMFWTHKVWEQKQQAEENRSETVKLLNYIHELEAENRKQEREIDVVLSKLFQIQPAKWYRVDIENEGIRYWIYTHRHMEGIGIVEESPPADAPSDRIFHSEKERRGSPLFQHICT